MKEILLFVLSSRLTLYNSFRKLFHLNSDDDDGYEGEDEENA